MFRFRWAPLAAFSLLLLGCHDAAPDPLVPPHEEAAAASRGVPLRPAGGGTVKACDLANGSCAVRAEGLALPAAITAGKDGTIWIAKNDAIPFGTARIRALP